MWIPVPNIKLSVGSFRQERAPLVIDFRQYFFSITPDLPKILQLFK